MDVTPQAKHKDIAEIDAVGIINKWITIAHKNGMQPHFRYFWYIRDIIEGTCYVPEKYRTDALKFIKEKCRDSKEKEKLERLEDNIAFSINNGFVKTNKEIIDAIKKS
jgi:hypothetical protein